MSVSIVTQTSVRIESGEDFSRWQGETSSVVSKFPGFIEQRLLPPNPPLQVDWVILQRFASLADAQRWLGSPERQKRIEGLTPMLVGRDDVHIVQDDAGAARSSPVSAVVSTRVKPGREAEYLEWEHKIAAAQSRARGLQGYRFEPAVPGVQEDHIAILRFDSQANLDAWLKSAERKKLVEEAEPLTVEFHARTVQSGFEQWFREAASPGAPPPAAWKMNMIVLLTLYPVVFLWSVFFGLPVLTDRLHMNFALALFIGNIFSVSMTAVLVPWTARHLLAWWMSPQPEQRSRIGALGAATVLAAYAAMVFVFWKFF
jgi:antibiotic biosynthesis monooxygenase (ABM) superfamily enzyme